MCAPNYLEELHQLSLTAPTPEVSAPNSAKPETQSDGGAAGVESTGGLSKTTKARAKMLREIDQYLEQLCLSELYAVRFAAKRLVEGRVKYGPINPLDGRDWLHEALEEELDKWNYLAMNELRETMLRAEEEW